MNTTVDKDSLWKDVIEEFFQDFLLFFAKDLYESVDFTKGYEFLEKEFTALFQDSEEGKRRADKLAKVHLNNGEEKWILVHVEVQGYRDEEFPKRMFEYFYRVYDKYNKKIFAISIFSDDSRSYKPQSFFYDFFGTTLTYTYNTYKILEQKEEQLKQSDNPFAMVVLAALYAIKNNKDDNAKYISKDNLIKRLFKAKWSKDKIARLFLFIDTMIKLPKDLALKLNAEVKELTGKGESNMALRWENTQTYEITIFMELAKTIRMLLCKKFKLDSLPDGINKKIDEAEISNLESIRDNIFDIESLEEVAEYLK